MMFMQQSIMMVGAFANPIAFKASTNQIGPSSGAGTFTTASKPSGVAVNDLVVVVVPTDEVFTTLATASGATWDHVTFNNSTSARHYSLYWKIMVAADITNAWNFSSGVDGTFSIAYAGNGATTVTLKETVVDPVDQSTLSFTGYVPDYRSRGAISILVDTDTDALDTPSDPRWIRRDYTQYPVGGGTQVHSYADNLGSYPGGALTWTNVHGAHGYAEIGILLDVT